MKLLDNTPVADLRNLGPVSRQMIAEIDAHTAGAILLAGLRFITLNGACRYPSKGIHGYSESG